MDPVMGAVHHRLEELVGDRGDLEEAGGPLHGAVALPREPGGSAQLPGAHRVGAHRGTPGYMGHFRGRGGAAAAGARGGGDGMSYEGGLT
jgi:hypothetical protein